MAITIKAIKNKVLCLGAIILTFYTVLSFFPIASALNESNYQIVENKVIAEIKLDSVQDFELKIPKDATAIEVSESYDIIEFDSFKKLTIPAAENLKIKYITSSYIEKSKDSYFFIAENLFNSTDITLYLPEGAVLASDEKKLVIPAADEITTDGRRIILKWNDIGANQIIVAYELLKKNNNSVVIALIIMIIVFAFIYFIGLKKYRKKAETISRRLKKTKAKKEDELTRNLYEDEKRIVRYLLAKKDHECWTKELIRELSISKVKLSRRLRSLEQKEIIKRLPYGNENRIRLIR